MERMISGIKPTGQLTLGNYVGAIKQFIKFQDKYELFVFIANLHALTLPIAKTDLKKNTEDLLAIYLAAGLDPTKTVIFKQSDVPAHNQLEWLLTCQMSVGELTKMPQYKNYCENHAGEGVPAGMLFYPSLMNADILLYDANYVPVGLDQKPHVDLTRDIAEKFNAHYQNSFILPKPIIPETGAKIMSLSDPTKKMSKSESDKGTIYLLEDINITRKKIMRAVTDSESKIYYDLQNKPGISNLLTIYAAMTNTTIDEAVARWKDEKDYGTFKSAVADVVCSELDTLQKTVANLKNSNTIQQVLTNGAQQANLIANRKINKIYNKVGLNF